MALVTMLVASDATRFVGVADEDAAQEVLTAAIAKDRDIMGNGGVLKSKMLVTAAFTFWTGLDVEAEEDEDEPPAGRQLGDDEEPHSNFDGTDYWDSFDRFAGAKTHSTSFAGFASRSLDMRHFEYAGECPIPECGDYVYERDCRDEFEPPAFHLE